MSSALLVLIVEKTKMIGILKALGMRNKSIRKVFVIHGGILIASGFILGNILAIIIIATQNHYGFLKLPQQNYYLSEVPMYFPTIKIVLLNITTFILCYTSMILPSIISTKISPVKAISSEI
jgi:lipoprotein-releasing system permease protein